MRHIVILATAVAAAFWLGPAFHHLPPSKRVGTAIVIAALMYAAGWAVSRRKAAKDPVAHTYPFAARRK